MSPIFSSIHESSVNPLGQAKAYSYDKMSRVTEYKDPAGNVTSYTYDALNRLTKKDIATTAGAHSVTDYAYDALNRLTNIVNPQGITVGFTYDAVGRRTGKKIFKSTPALLAEAEYVYDAAGQLLSITNRAGGKVVAFDNYKYDAVGNRVLKEDQTGATKYGYDKSNRLITAEPVPFDMAGAEGFVYDRNGNRRFDRGAKDYQYDAANRVLNNSVYTYTHDANGNLTARTEIASSATATYAYNPEQQLAEVVTPTDKLEYKYDPLGRRTTRTVNNTTVHYVYDGQDIIAELNEAGEPINTYTNGPGIDEPLVVAKPDGKAYFYHADALGSITAITDDNRKLVETYHYKAYGQPTIKDASGQIIAKSSIGNLRLFAAREYEPEIGFYNNRHRYLDPSRGAFTQSDPIDFKGRDHNLYRFVVNSPTQYSDPNGTVLPLVVYPILAYTLWDAALNSTYTSTPDGGVLTIPPPILWSTALPGLWGAQVNFKTKEFNGILFNIPVGMSFVVPKAPNCKVMD